MIEQTICSLGSIASVQTGPFGSQLHQEDYVDCGTPIITVEHLVGNRVSHENLPLVSESDKERLSRYILREGDIVFSRVGSVDRCAYVSKNEDGWLFSGRCLRIRVDEAKVNPRYLSFYFAHPAFKAYIRKIAVGATMPSLNTTIMSELGILLPPLPTQKKIAAILSSLDDKIEINTRMNKVLEEIARALFHRWFVEFEFPNDEGKPYKSSGGRMIASEMGEIPEGWRVGNLRDLVTFSYGKPLKENDRLGGSYPVFGSNGIVGWHNEWIVEGPGIIVGRKGNPGIITWSPYNFYPIDTTFYVVPVSKDYGLHYLYSLLEKLQLSHLSADSAVPGLNREAAMSEQIIIPQKNVVKIFEEVSSVLFSLKRRNEEENRNLSVTRDKSLSMLINNELQSKQ